MDGFLLKSQDGVLGLIALDEEREVVEATFLLKEKRLMIGFATGEREKLLSEIDPEFAEGLTTLPTLFVAHYARDGLDGDPTTEYHIPLG